MLNNLGEILKIIRIAKDYSTKTVAEATKFRSSYISDIESGRRKGMRMETLQKFADTYSFSVSEIFSLVEFYQKLKVDDPKQKYRLTLLHVLRCLDEKENCPE